MRRLDRIVPAHVAGRISWLTLLRRDMKQESDDGAAHG